MLFEKVAFKNFPNLIGKRMCRNLFPISYEFCEVFKNTLFKEQFRTTAFEYRNNMSRTFKTKCEKNESNDILIPYLPLHFNGLNFYVTEL